jgi:hypothetical protein
MARIPDERYAPEKAEHSHVNTLREKLADMIRPTPPAATVEELPPRVVEAAACRRGRREAAAQTELASPHYQ